MVVCKARNSFNLYYNFSDTIGPTVPRLVNVRLKAGGVNALIRKGGNDVGNNVST
jgi:hypothetical protein